MIDLDSRILGFLELTTTISTRLKKICSFTKVENQRQKRQTPKCSSVLPIGLWFFNHVMVGGGIPVASQVSVTGLLTVSTMTSLSGPSIVGGTVKRQKKNAHHR